MIEIGEVETALRDTTEGNPGARSRLVIHVAEALPRILTNAGVAETDLTGLPKSWARGGWLIDSVVDRVDSHGSTTITQGRQDLWARRREGRGGELRKYWGFYLSEQIGVVGLQPVRDEYVSPGSLMVWNRELEYRNIAHLAPLHDARLCNTDAMTTRVAGFIDHHEVPAVAQGALEVIEQFEVFEAWSAGMHKEMFW